MLLEVKDLSVTFDTPDGEVRAVQNVSFELDTGQTLGIVGESGSGKSVSTQAIVGLLRGAEITGQSLFDGVDLLPQSDHKLRELRGAGIGMVFQDPLSSLHPYYRVGWQISEAIRAHTKVSKGEARARVIELLRHVRIPTPERRIDDYPHQFSGGMRQRAMIAIALACNPKLLIADGPTTALDGTIQAQILDLLAELKDRLGMAIMLITHAMGVVAEVAQRVVVMYAGQVIEEGSVEEVFERPWHPYTQGLIRSIPRIDSDASR